MAVEEGRIVGFASLRAPAESEKAAVGELVALCTDPSVWGVGVAAP